MKKSLKSIAIAVSYILMVIISFVPVKALDPSDQASFDQILTPVTRIYNFVKYASTTIAMLFLVFVAITYMTSGSDAKKRDNAKLMAGSIIFGLVIIWATPYVVNYLIK